MIVYLVVGYVKYTGEKYGPLDAFTSREKAYDFIAHQDAKYVSIDELSVEELEVK